MTSNTLWTSALIKGTAIFVARRVMWQNCVVRSNEKTVETVVDVEAVVVDVEAGAVVDMLRREAECSCDDCG